MLVVDVNNIRISLLIAKLKRTMFVVDANTIQSTPMVLELKCSMFIVDVNTVQSNLITPELNLNRVSEDHLTQLYLESCERYYAKLCRSLTGLFAGCQLNCVLTLGTNGVKLSGWLNVTETRATRWRLSYQ